MLGLENHLELPGLLPHAQVLEIMSNATVFLHTSHYEGNSTVLMEALYCGCYVVSTQPLSRSNPKNLIVAKNKEDLFRSALVRLNDNNAKAERVVFNTMDDTAGKIMDYFF